MKSPASLHSWRWGALVVAGVGFSGYAPAYSSLMVGKPTHPQPSVAGAAPASH